METEEQARVEILQKRSRQSFENVIIPALIGGLTGIMTQFMIDGDILSNPWGEGSYLSTIWNMHAALLCVAVTGPLSMTVHFLRKERKAELLEFLLGGAFLLVVAALLSTMRGCGAFVLVFIWFIASGTWSRYELPPFRLGFWWGLGLVVGALSGVLAMDLRT
ncbi:MAG: hypothetical protein NZ770_06185 [Candidatus Poseidoniaceae archaeon]|nr:hypothetical protein [Candidatus Poseidoniaceae archaeon]